jgi:hypothetical protein
VCERERETEGTLLVQEPQLFCGQNYSCRQNGPSLVQQLQEVAGQRVCTRTRTEKRNGTQYHSTTIVQQNSVVAVCTCTVWRMEYLHSCVHVYSLPVSKTPTVLTVSAQPVTIHNHLTVSIHSSTVCSFRQTSRQHTRSLAHTAIQVTRTHVLRSLSRRTHNTRFAVRNTRSHSTFRVSDCAQLVPGSALRRNITADEQRVDPSTQ